MYHPVPSSFFFLEWQDLWDFCHLVPYKKRNLSVKKGYKTAKFGMCSTSFPGFWHNHKPRNSERVLLTLSWLDQSWVFTLTKINIWHQTGFTWVKPPMFPQWFLGVFVSIMITLLMKGQIERAVALVNLCLSFRQLGCCKHFGLWRTVGQFLRPKEPSKQI